MLAEHAGSRRSEASIDVTREAADRVGLDPQAVGLTPPGALDLVFKLHPSTASWPSFADLTASHLQAMLDLSSFLSQINLSEV